MELCHKAHTPQLTPHVQSLGRFLLIQLLFQVSSSCVAFCVYAYFEVRVCPLLINCGISLCKVHQPREINLRRMKEKL
ncbi:hypothetical protein B0J14DRAFT_581446, partial [Halenospora varia]